MEKGGIEGLKRAIKRTHKRYTGERTNGKASIKDVANFFNIPIDEARMEDYSITKISYIIPSIELFDEKTNTTYSSKYTSDARLLNCYSFGEPCYNSLLATTPTYKIESLYYINGENPIVEKLTFNEGEYNLEFEREFPHCIGLFRNDSIRFVISYIKNIIHNKQKVEQSLLTRVYANPDNDSNFTNCFEQMYTYGLPFEINGSASQDKYTYIRNNSVIYGIGELSFFEKGCSLKGNCFENTLDKTIDYSSYDIDVRDYPELNDKKTTSAMIFYGYAEGQSHYVQIYKNGSEAIIHYSKKNKGEITSEEMRIKLSQPGNISSEEVQLVALSLLDKYSDNVFISLVSDELMNFSKKIDIKNGTAEEEMDLLNPKLYINNPLEKTAIIVGKNKDEFFKTIADQFEAASNISETSKNVHKKVATQ